MKKIIFGLFAIISVAFASCSREGPMEELKQDIPWAFCVTAVSDDINKQPVAGATVEIYRTSDDRENGTNIYLSGTTDEKGEVTFTFADFNKNNQGVDAIKGIYYLRVTGNGVVKDELTRYLLMNSGTTTQWIQLI